MVPSEMRSKLLRISDTILRISIFVTIVSQIAQKNQGLFFRRKCVVNVSEFATHFFA
ncbi:hypothetical protein Hanom_Chr13g01211901 [Helianthus anomalus]